ncbi:hypothetical protein BLS_002589 [Venturia inaequalis]|uniref:Uncharacterized protein n=1 Tax=Venturia inaequalis TaxID=5025 RepID=A0A8H3URX7_VENIN|nr:hypothetical protein BLS_002589 [Venturia inaequalis]KAE9981463.1 hypothetical protein EG328_011614 [Venturia inaequalis]KAE9989248.1 hypothetical protein EG327_002950 [Venturia inaequalis]RDI85722.1 hypothetical protein Vi05172_g4272 [Venturia inaequalis]
MFSASLALSMLSALALATSLAPRQAVGSITCDNGGAANILTSDITTIIASLNANGVVSGLNSGDPIFLGDGFEGFTTETGTQGTFQFTLDNQDLFDATHVSFSTVAQALASYQGQCCGTFAMCIGGSTQVQGDTGLKVDLKMEAV